MSDVAADDGEDAALSGLVSMGRSGMPYKAGAHVMCFVRCWNSMRSNVLYIGNHSGFGVDMI